MFQNISANEANIKWEKFIYREDNLYSRNNKLRSDFYRDYTRILHSTSYRRLKHKTQVFFATKNDHICTRSEHVNHVASVSYTIGKHLGLNTELIQAIATGHDVGHPPFGHHGEVILKSIIQQHDLLENYWHEKNSLWFLDKIETLPNPDGKYENLNLTYAVRDGIICHCGEVDENGLKPREDAINLNTIKSTNDVNPYTWEGCVVKISDKIAYLGRDIEDALALNILSHVELSILSKIIKDNGLSADYDQINNSIIMNNFIADVCSYSSPEKGIVLSENNFKLMKAIKDFNYNYIYSNGRLNYFKEYATTIIESLFYKLYSYYSENTQTIISNISDDRNIYPFITESFYTWLIKLSDIDIMEKSNRNHINSVIYQLKNRNDYIHAVIDFISGMTDNYIIDLHNELISFR